MIQKEKVAFLSSFFVALLILTSLMGSKITVIGGVQFSVALFAFPFTFLITDIIAEVMGREEASRLVRTSFITLIFVLLMVTLFISLPFAERSFVREEYTFVFSSSVRILIASIISFYLSQTHDVRAFLFWKQRTAGRYLWLRNNASTILSQFIDTALFYCIAFLYLPFLPSFLNTSPDYTLPFIFRLLLPYYGLKVIVALCDTPLVYLGVRWLTAHEEHTRPPRSSTDLKRSRRIVNDDTRAQS